MIDNGQSTVNGMQGSVLSGAQTASTISSMVDISLGTVKDQLDLFNGSIKKIDINTDISMPQANFDALSLKKGEKHIPIDEEWSGYDE